MPEQLLPEWLPDWRDPSSYPDPKNTSRTQWAWEFLRRNRSYQAEWKKVDEDRSFFKGLPRDWQPSDRDIQLSKYGPMLHLGGKWGLACPAPDPSLDAPEILLFHSSSLIGAVSFENAKMMESFSLVPERWESMTLMFDLSQPLHPQLQDAKNSLEKTRDRYLGEGKIELEKNPRKSPAGHQLHNYLRCYDGKVAGATIREIAGIVFDFSDNSYESGYLADQRVRDSIKAAAALVSEKHRFLDNVHGKK
jgi:hypothetical protein